jgi:phosphopantothenoylcysteine decarboxylase
MANVLLGVTGSVAAIKTPDLYAHLRRLGHQVKVVATQAALYFFDPAALDPLPRTPPQRNPNIVVVDEDEWPSREQGGRYQRGDDVLHIELRRWADLLLIAPLDANTLAKLVNGLADNCLTCIWRAWEPSRPVLLAPAMNTLMWQHPLTSRHLRQLAADEGVDVPRGLLLDEVVLSINTKCRRLRVIPPRSQRLACGDIGVGALAGLDQIAAAVAEHLAHAD